MAQQQFQSAAVQDAQGMAQTEKTLQEAASEAEAAPEEG